MKLNSIKSNTKITYFYIIVTKFDKNRNINNVLAINAKSFRNMYAFIYL